MLDEITAMRVIGIVLISAGGCIALANWLTLIVGYSTKRFCSPVPFVGAILLGAGMLLLPPTRLYCWSALFFDYGTLAFLIALPRLGREFWNTSRLNLLNEYIGQTGKKMACLRLFKKGVFTIRLNITRRPNEPGLVSTGLIGTWERSGDQIQLTTNQGAARFDVISNIQTETLRQTDGFADWENGNDTSLAGFDFIKIMRTSHANHSTRDVNKN